jgi:hypothetical protein
MNLDGKIDEGYWWLAYEWRNLYLVCELCNQKYKRNRFPVEGRRAKKLDELEKEKALLIDPCRVKDFEEQHFTFEAADDGLAVDVVPLTERGEVTVEILGLNRDPLRIHRGSEWADFLKLMHSASQKKISRGMAKSSLQALLGADQPYLAMKRQLAVRFARKNAAMYGVLGSVSEDLKRLPEKKISKATVKRKREQKKAEQTAYSVLDESKVNKERYFSALKEIEKVRIQNFRILRDISLDFVHTMGAEASSWLTLIGENATGKSTVLKAIALTLLGAEEREKLQLQPEEYITHGQAAARIDVHLTNIDQPVTLTITRKPPEFACNVRDPLVLLLGYGSTRLLRRFTEDVEKERQLIRINNLFNPYQKLNHVEKWLGDTVAVPTSKFNMIREALMRLLLLEPGSDAIRRRGGRVYVTLRNTRYKLEELSDGYQSVLALALDIMRVLVDKWQSIRDAEAIVLIDEIGVHLHPRWRMWITPLLMRTFPGLQFVVTTHEPLCLRGLEKGQVVLMRRNEDSGEVEMVTSLPSPAEFRVDQLLTSSFFGLNSAMDPETEALFNEYYLLLAKKRPTSQQRKRIAKLKLQLHDRRHLGSTPRDHIMYEVIDRLLAHDKHRQLDRPIGEIKEEAVQQIAKRWNAKFGID